MVGTCRRSCHCRALVGFNALHRRDSYSIGHLPRIHQRVREVIIRATKRLAFSFLVHHSSSPLFAYDHQSARTRRESRPSDSRLPAFLVSSREGKQPTEPSGLVDLETASLIAYRIASTRRYIPGSSKGTRRASNVVGPLNEIEQRAMAFNFANPVRRATLPSYHGSTVQYYLYKIPGIPALCGQYARCSSNPTHIPTRPPSASLAHTDTMAYTTNPCILYGQGCTSPTNIPEFIDTSACLCGLLPSREPDPNGGLIEKWRCIGNASANVVTGDNGRWYNTSLPSQELSGINEPQNWGQNPPDPSQSFILITVGGNPKYEDAPANGSPQLIGNDVNCNGRNDTELSGSYYRGGVGASHTTSHPPSTSAHPTSATKPKSGFTTKPSPSKPAPSKPNSKPTSSTASHTSAPTPKTTSTHGHKPAPKKPRKGRLVLFGITLAPIVSMLA